MAETNPPPIITLLTELAAWTSERTADFPRPAHSTLGARLDGLSLDALEAATEARFAAKKAKAASLHRLNLKLELLRCFWRIALDRGFIAQRQAVFVHAKIDEIGRMAGAWLRSLGGGTEAG
jgi:hypothetical protein